MVERTDHDNPKCCKAWVLNFKVIKTCGILGGFGVFYFYNLQMEKPAQMDSVVKGKHSIIIKR